MWSVTLAVRTCFLIFRGNLLCFSLWPWPLVLSLSTTEKSLAPSSLHPPLRYLYTLVRSPWAFSSPGWTVPALSAFPHSGDAPVHSSSSWSFAGHSSRSMSLFLTLRTPELDPALQVWSHQCLSRGGGPPPSTCWQCFAWCSPGYHLPPLLQGPTAGSWFSVFTHSNELKADCLNKSSKIKCFSRLITAFGH